MSQALRPSGIDWLGDVPAHWAVAPLYARYNVQLGKMLNPDAAAGPYQAPYLGNADVQWGSVSVTDLSTMSFAPSERERFRLRHGDLLVCEGGDVGRTAVWRSELSECFYQKALHRLRPRLDDEGQFFYYVMCAATERGVFAAEGNRSTIVHLTGDKLRSHRFPFPPKAEQLSIAAFLDCKAAAIDALIAKKERLIELLQEKRQALITQAVTKGLSRSASLKQSGVAWIGEVPTHWRCMRLKFTCRLETGHTPSRSDDENWIPEECVIPWVSLNDTKSLELQDYISDTAIKISRRGMDNSSAHMIDAGAVVFNRDGARIGLAAIMTRPMAVSQHIIAWVCGPRLLNEYLLLALYAMEDELYRLTAGATIPTIGMGDVKELVCPVPPLTEQRAIVAYLNRERAKIADALALIERQCVVLKEYRQALITAAVTGKLDVREPADYALPTEPTDLEA